MLSSRQTLFTALAGGVFLCLPSGLGGEFNLQATGNPVVVGEDNDGDGLDDVLELRLGTSLALADSDADGLSDHEEFLLGTDPKTPDNLGALVPVPATYLDIYALGKEVVLHVSTYYQVSVEDPTLVFSNEFGTDLYPLTDFGRQLFAYDDVQGFFPGWNIRRATFRIPHSLFAQQGNFALGILARIDDDVYGSSIMLADVGGFHAQLRNDLFSTSGNGGGVFPVDPRGQDPEAGDRDDVCVQTLQPISYLSLGKIEYKVVTASCQPLANAVCFSACIDTVEDVLIGIDIQSLIP